MCNTRGFLAAFEFFCLVILYNVIFVTITYPLSYRFLCPFYVVNTYSILAGVELSPDQAQCKCSEMQESRRHPWSRLFSTNTPAVDQEPTTCLHHLRSHNITCGGGRSTSGITCGGGRSTSGDSGITCDTDVTRGWYNLTPGVYRYREYSN